MGEFRAARQAPEPLQPEGRHILAVPFSEGRNLAQAGILDFAALDAGLPEGQRDVGAARERHQELCKQMGGLPTPRVPGGATGTALGAAWPALVSHFGRLETTSCADRVDLPVAGKAGATTTTGSNAHNSERCPWRQPSRAALFLHQGPGNT